MLTNFILALVFASVALVQALPLPYHGGEPGMFAPGIKLSRRFDRFVPTLATREGVTWHITPDGEVAFDQLVSIGAKRDQCSITADGRAVGDCHITPGGDVAFDNLVMIAAKRDGPHPDNEPVTRYYGRDWDLSSIGTGDRGS